MVTSQQTINKVGVFKAGWGKNADNQTKKHVDQMTASEKEYLAFLLNGMQSGFRIHPHLQMKQQKRLVSFDILTIQKTLRSPHLYNCIKEYSEIEKSEGVVDRRVLVRSSKKERVLIKGKGMLMCNLLFVVSLDTSEIITAYYSHKNHTYEMNSERYDENLSIM